MAWHPEILAGRQQQVLAEMGPCLTKHGFYLAGGTAVALTLGHRRSVDLDWFTPEFPDTEDLLEELEKQGINVVSAELKPGTVHGTVRGVRFSLLRYRYPMLADLRMWRRVRIAARADLAAMKLLAVSQRGAKKDFVDIYALAKKTNTLRSLLQWYRRKFNTEDIAHLMCSLVYFADADPERMPRMLWKVDWQTVKDTVRRWVESTPR